MLRFPFLYNVFFRCPALEIKRRECGISWVRESFAWEEDEEAFRYLLFGDPDILEGVIEGLLEMKDLYRSFFGLGSCRRF